MKMNFTVKFSLPVIVALPVMLFAGCTTRPPIDWDSRIGHYSYEQAVTELGPPDRQARLSDGKSVYKWFVQPPLAPRFNSGMSYYGNSGFGVSQTPGSSFNTQKIQLTFDTNGTLIAWSRNNY